LKTEVKSRVEKDYSHIKTITFDNSGTLAKDIPAVTDIVTYG
jgi:cation transport ATPase